MNIGSITVTTASDYAAADQLARTVLHTLDAQIHDNLELKGQAMNEEQRAEIDTIIQELTDKKKKVIANYIKLQDDLITQFTTE